MLNRYFENVEHQYFFSPSSPVPATALGGANDTGARGGGSGEREQRKGPQQRAWPAAARVVGGGVRAAQGHAEAPQGGRERLVAGGVRGARSGRRGTRQRAGASGAQGPRGGRLRVPAEHGRT